MVWIQLQVTSFRIIQPSETNFQPLSSDLHPRDRRPGRRPRGLPLPHPADVPVPDAAAPLDQVLLAPVPLHDRPPVPRLPEGRRRAVLVDRGSY